MKDIHKIGAGTAVAVATCSWARAGVFQLPSAPNSDILNWKTGGAVAELEERYAILEQSGKLRLGVFGTQGNTASYRDADLFQSSRRASMLNFEIIAEWLSLLRFVLRPSFSLRVMCHE